MYNYGLPSGIECCYNDITSKCDHCEVNGKQCVSLFILGLLSDKASSQVKVARTWNAVLQSIDKQRFTSRFSFTYAFGGLHNMKNLVNFSRNYLLTGKLLFKDDPVISLTKGRAASGPCLHVRGLLKKI